VSNDRLHPTPDLSLSGGGETKVGLPPIARADARLFILGSLPGDASLAARRYYAHPQNQFWRLLGSVIGEDLQSLSYEARLERLAENTIGLWDVFGSAARRGSLDQAIRSRGHNRIEQLLEDYPQLDAIAFNGGTAAATGRKLLGGSHPVTLIDLPSSSPANTRPFLEKAAVWSRLRQFCGPASCARGQSGRHEADDADRTR
jgi:double-stranded uracil-DNA glycosylase